MKRNTVSKCLIWWVKEGVLKGTAQLRGPTIYELVLYPVERDIDTSKASGDECNHRRMYLTSSEPVELESNIPSDVIQYPV